MRQGTNNRRSRGRGGRKQPSGRFQTFDSNGPNGRLRGNAHQLYEKYVTLGRDAAGSGDRITAENLMQHAEHYFRIVNANTPDNPNRPRVNGEGEQSETEAAPAEVQETGSNVQTGAVAETETKSPAPKGNGESQPGDDESPGADEGDADTPAPAETKPRRARGNGRSRQSRAKKATENEAPDEGQAPAS